MSLVLQSLSGGTAAATSGTVSAPEGTAATAVPFAQTLVQTMGGSAAQTTVTPLLGNLAALLQGLLNTVQTTTGEDQGNTNEENTELLGDLAEDMEKLDESLSSDPALLEALQGWLVQVSTLLAGSNSNAPDETGDADAGGNLSPLAQNPETVRFAVQDDLNSLVTMIQEAASSGNEEVAGKGITLLNNFSALLEQSVPTESKTKGNNPTVVDSQPAAVELTAGTDRKADTKDKPLAHLTGRAAEAVVVKSDKVLTSPAATVTNSTESEVVTLPLAKVVAAADVKQTDLTLDTSTEITPTAENHEIVTAGQLSLRGGINAPLKAEGPVLPVPVQQFAQEMTGFITGKLEIVKKGGIAEATITLFPENLGQVDVKITMQNGHLVAQFMTEHASAKDMLEQQMNQLRSALQSQGLQVEKLEVTQNNTPLQSQLNQEGRQPGSGGQQQDRRSKERGEDTGDAILAAELNGEWREWVSNVQQENQSQGGTFSAKA